MSIFATQFCGTLCGDVTKHRHSSSTPYSDDDTTYSRGSIIWGQDKSFMYVWILEETEMHTQEENQGNIKWGQESDIKDSFSHA